MMPKAQLEKTIAELTGKGYPVVQSLKLPFSTVAFFDTRKEIGVFTEIIGLNDAGTQFAQQLKSEAV
jgi:hypothetical protein